MRNVKAFLEAGGNAEWDYIVFRHNEHQVEQARRLAKDLGFSRFNVKTTGRFLNSAKLEYIHSTPTKNRAGEIVGRVARPLSLAYQNSALAELQDLRNRYGSMDRYLDRAQVQCKVQVDNSIYVSAEGYVLPCCWLAGQLRDSVMRTRAEILELLEALGGTAHVDGRRRSVRAIVEDDFFQSWFPAAGASRVEQRASCAPARGSVATTSSHSKPKAL
jgi:hypothetical protein